MTDLDRAVAAVVNECLGVREGETVLVVCNPATIGLGERLRGEAGRAGADAMHAMMAERATHGTEPPAPSRRRWRPPTSSSARPSSRSPTRPRAARRTRPGRGSRPSRGDRGDAGAGDERRHRGAAPQAAKRRRAADRRLGGADHRANGSRPAARARGTATGIPDAGDLTAPGAFGNLPCGEGFIAPIEGTSEGTLVVDGTIGGIGRVQEPVEITVRGGHLIARAVPQGGAADGDAAPPAGRRAPTSPSSGSAPTRRRSSPGAARGREDLRHLPRRVRRLGGDRRHASRSRSTSTASS